MSQKTLNLCLERYNFVKFGETTKSSHTVLCINNAYSVNSDKYRLTPAAIASKHGEGYVFTLNYDFDRPLFTIVQKSYALDGTSGNIVFEGIDPISKGGSKYLRKVTVSPVKLSDGSYLLEVTNDEYLRIGTTGAALGDEELESLNEKIVTMGGIEKSVETVGGKQVLKLDAGGPSGAKEIVYFDIDPSNPPSGIYDTIGETLSNNKEPVIRIDDAVYFYSATGTDKYVFVGGYTKEAVGYTEIEVSDDDSVTSKPVDDKVFNMYLLYKTDPASPGDPPGDEDSWVCDANKHVITKDELVAAHADCRYFILNNDVDPDSNSRKYFAAVTNVSSSYVQLRFYMVEYSGEGAANFYQKTVSNDSEGRLYISDSYQTYLAGTSQAVLVSEPQSFNATQKAQGRDNIGAASASDVTALQSQVSSLSDVSAYSVKGEATVAQLNAGPSGIQAGWAYQLTDSGTLTDGTLAVVAGDTVAWDGTKWFPLEGIGEAVNEWLNEHPEATTTVQNDSLTEQKFTENLKKKTIKDYVTPEMFGAKGDGVTDDTQALQDAFDTGKSVFIPSGKTYITTGNIVGSGIVFGNGFGSRIKAASKEQPYVLKIAGSNKVIKNICIHGSGDTDPSGDFGDAVGIVTEGSRSRINLDGVFIVCCDIGLYFKNTNWDCLFSRLIIYYCNTALKTDDAMLCCKFDSCTLSHNRTQFDLTRGTFVLFENCGIGSSTTENFAKIYSAHSVRFFNCNFEESVVSSDSGAFEFLNQDNIIIFEGCYIRKVSKATGSSNTALFRTNTGLSRNSIIFRNSRFMANSVDYHVYVANGDQSLQFSFDWTSFAFMVDITSGGSLACNFTSANNTLFRITDVPKLRNLINASVFGGQKFKGFQCIVGDGVRYEYTGNVFRQVPTVPEATYAGEYVLAYDSYGLFWKPDPNIYNPLNLPDYTIRFKTHSAVTQADFVKGTLSEIDGQNYIYEINYQNTDWTSVFDGNTALVEVLGANLSKVTKLYRTFFGCSNMTKCALFDTSNVTTFYAAFYNCTRLASAPKFLLNKAENLYGMFHNCQALTSLPDLDFYVVENCSLIFDDCRNVSDGDSMTSAYGKLSALESVETYGAAFRNCGVNTTDGAAALAQIPTSWGGTMQGE